MKSHIPLAYLFSNYYFKMENYMVYIPTRSYIRDSLLSQVIVCTNIVNQSRYIGSYIQSLDLGRIKQEDCRKFKAYYWVHNEFMARSGLQNETLPI